MKTVNAMKLGILVFPTELVNVTDVELVEAVAVGLDVLPEVDASASNCDQEGNVTPACEHTEEAALYALCWSEELEQFSKIQLVADSWKDAELHKQAVWDEPLEHPLLVLANKSAQLI